MQPSFSPSINIVRDAARVVDYIPTPNARRVYNQILDNYALGLRSFSIIGSYGTGKSAFLLALRQTLDGQAAHFPSPNGNFAGVRQFRFVNIVGSYASLTDAVAAAFGLADPALIWDHLNQLQSETAPDTCLVLILDEFGKFLEYAAHTNPERELYFIQQLAEYANDVDKNFLLLAVLHQSFYAYATGLDRQQRDEWEKVKGRLKELTFNEPVEQLLELAAQVMPRSQTSAVPTDLARLVDAISTARVLPQGRHLNADFADRLYPLDLVAASVLTHALQHYGQNERSLFTFLRAHEYLGLDSYDRSRHPYYNLACVHDYLLHNYYALLSTAHNPHYAGWGAIRRAVERAEHTLNHHVLAALLLVKTIGLLNIFAGKGARITEQFLVEYGRLALGIDDPKPILKELEDRKIVRYVNYRETYVLFDGTDLDLEHALLEAAAAVEPVTAIVPELRRIFEFPFILAKDVSYRVGTPRFFAFQLSEQPVNDRPEGVTDGIINLVFSDALSEDELLTHSADHRPNLLFGWYRTAPQIVKLLHELRAIEHVIRSNQDDRIAVRELTALRQNQIERLNTAVLDGLYATDGSIVWAWNGELLSIDSPRDLNRQLSAICRAAYPDTPHYRNELINRHNLPSAIATARRYFVRALLDSVLTPDLGFPSDRYPAEKSVYLTLLRDTGIHRAVESGYALEAPTAASFQPLWQHGEDWLASTRVAPRPLSELIDAWLAPPFKLKQGFVDFWLPVFLIAQRERFALYRESTFVPSLSLDVFDLIYRDPRKFRIKAFAVDGVRLRIFNRFRALLQQSAGTEITATSFIETIKPFLVFYSGLPDYAKRTQRLDPATLRLRDVISQATDPEQTFFEEFPQALGFQSLQRDDLSDVDLEEYVTRLRAAVHELQSCYDDLLDRIEQQVREAFALPDDLDFATYRPLIVARYRGLRNHLLRPDQKSLHMRLTSALDDRTAWLNAVVQAVLGKTITAMRDDDELLLFDRLRQAVHALDNLTELSAHADDEHHQAVKIKIARPAATARARTVLLPKYTRRKRSTICRPTTATLPLSSHVPNTTTYETRL